MKIMKAVTGVAAGALLVATVGCGGKGESARAEATTAPTVTLGAGDLGVATKTTLVAGMPLSGPLTPKVSVVVGAPIAEQLAEMMVNEGDAVREGQPIARFRDDVLKANAASAQADVSTARMQVRMAVAESTRAEALFAEGAIARRDFDNAMVAVEAARSRQALTESQAANAADRVSTATLRAPVSGVVSVRSAQAGDRVDFGKPVLTIVNTSVLQLEASVESRWLPDLRIGRPVSLVVTGMDRDTLTGHIARINPVADPATRQVRVYVEVANPGNRLVGGLYVSGFAVTHEAKDVVAVPKTAIRLEGTQRENVVYVVASGRIARRVVQPGIEDARSGLVQVTGVNAGEAVVVSPVDGLAEGTRVETAAPVQH